MNIRNENRRRKNRYPAVVNGRARLEPHRIREQQLLDAKEDFPEYLKQQAIKTRITMDQSRYITGSYEKKRETIGKMMKVLVDNLFKEFPKPEDRLEYANVINLTISFSEMWQWIGTTMNREYRFMMKSFVPCALIDKFHEFINTVTRCQRHSNTDMGTYSNILRLRDEIVQCLQEYYRIVKPLYEGRQASFPTQSELYRYHPYDFEWLAGSIITGPSRLACVRYLYISRIAHLDASALRTDIIASKHRITMRFLKHLRVPLPAEGTDCALLTEALDRMESKMLEDYQQGYEILKPQLVDNPDVIFMNNIARFLKVTHLIRIKKRTSAEILPSCEPERLIPIYQLISVLVTLETHLLLVHRVGALFVDLAFGIHGIPFPDRVLDLVEKACDYATEETCRQHPLCDQLCEWLSELREASRDFCREFYTAHEEVCETLKTAEIEIEVPEGDEDYAGSLQLATNNFPEEVGHYLPALANHLTLQQIEIRRLLTQFHQIRYAVAEWPSILDRVLINICPPGIGAFYNNVPAFFNVDNIDPTEDEPEDSFSEASNINSVGFEMITQTRVLIVRHKAAPNYQLLKEKFLEKFQKEMGPKMVTLKKDPLELAEEFATIIDHDIRLLKYHEQFAADAQKTAEVADKVVWLVVRKYMEYVNEYREVCGEDEEGIATPEEDGSSEESESSSNETEIVLSIQAEISGPEGMEGAELVATAAHASHLAFMVDALELTPSEAAVLEAASKALFVEDPAVIYLQSDVVPDEMIDSFLDNIASINMPPQFDMSAPCYNTPLD